MEASLKMGVSLRTPPKEKYADVFSIPTQLPPLDHFSVCCGYDVLDFHPEFAFQETDLHAVSLLDMFESDPLYTSSVYVQNCTTYPEAIICRSGFESRCRRRQHQSRFEEGLSSEDERSVKNGSDSKRLSRKTISKYFYFPIAQAAKELKVGLTHLKKRCRELGIRRWPHRKLMSLQTLIKNVQEMGVDEIEENIREAAKILEQEKTQMEENPNLKLKGKTMKLRQALFKASYKKRKVSMDTSAITTNPGIADDKAENGCGSMDEEDDDVEFKSFFL